jgi:hypothetical protein
MRQYGDDEEVLRERMDFWESQFWKLWEKYLEEVLPKDEGPTLP